MLTPAGGELPERRGRELLERRGVQLGNYLNADTSNYIPRLGRCGPGSVEGARPCGTTSPIDGRNRPKEAEHDGSR